MRLCLAALVVVLGCTSVAAPAKRPAVDPQAMREAIRSAEESGGAYSSSAAYGHYLKSRLLHHVGNHRSALDELRLALASEPQNPFLLTALAEEYARLTDLARAERTLRRVIERNPRYYPAQLLMGRVLFEGQKYTRARVFLQRAIKLRPQEPSAYLVLTQLWLDVDRVDEAVAAVDALGAALPGEPVGYRRLGLALASRGEAAPAERMLRRAVERDPGDSEAWSALAQLYEGAQRWKDAEEAYEAALNQEPENRDLLLSAGRLALRQGSVDAARTHFNQLLSLADDPELAVKIAFSYLANRQLPEAAEVLDSARQSGVTEPRVRFYAGLVHERLRRFRQAAEAYAEVERSAGELFHEARLHRAICLSRAGQHRTALGLLREALSDKPEYLVLYPAYAQALERSGSTPAALKFLEKSVRERPSPELFEALASMYERQGRLADAIELLTGALTQQPKDEVLLYTLGTTYQRQGDLERSLRSMRAVLAVNPENAMAMNFIGYTLADKGLDFAEAERLLTRALELRPDNGAFLDSLGWVYFRKGEYPRAVELLERAVSLAPGEPTIFEHLGDAYHRVSSLEQAADAYRKALEALSDTPELAESREQRAAIERKLKMLSSEAARR